MDIRLALTRTACAATLILSTVAVGACVSPALTPTPPPTTSAASCEEDMPCWICSADDDRCAGSSDPYAVTAWETFEEVGGAKSLKVDDSRPFRVDYMGSFDNYPQNMDTYDLALVGKDFRWYVFRAAYTN